MFSMFSTVGGGDVFQPSFPLLGINLYHPLSGPSCRRKTCDLRRQVGLVVELGASEVQSEKRFAAELRNTPLNGNKERDIDAPKKMQAPGRGGLSDCGGLGFRPKRLSCLLIFVQLRPNQSNFNQRGPYAV
jgi:hypothetical protein